MTKKHGPDPYNPQNRGKWFSKSVATRRAKDKQAKKSRKRNR